jgi:hypothetical protein
LIVSGLGGVPVVDSSWHGVELVGDVVEFVLGSVEVAFAG